MSGIIFSTCDTRAGFREINSPRRLSLGELTEVPMTKSDAVVLFRHVGAIVAIIANLIVIIGAF